MYVVHFPEDPCHDQSQLRGKCLVEAWCVTVRPRNLAILEALDLQWSVVVMGASRSSIALAGLCIGCMRTCQDRLDRGVYPFSRGGAGCIMRSSNLEIRKKISEFL